MNTQSKHKNLAYASGSRPVSLIFSYFLAGKAGRRETPHPNPSPLGEGQVPAFQNVLIIFVDVILIIVVALIITFKFSQRFRSAGSTPLLKERGRGEVQPALSSIYLIRDSGNLPFTHSHKAYICKVHTEAGSELRITNSELVF